MKQKMTKLPMAQMIKKFGSALLILSLFACNQQTNSKQNNSIQQLTLPKPSSQTNLLAYSPPMGWNSWNWFGKQEVNEVNMKECMDAMVEEGLLEAGYNYFIIDGGWRDTKLGPNGELLAHPVKFPNGIKPLADYAHSLGLKFGLHTVPGTHDCGKDKVGGLGHEEVHVQQFVDWGIDFIKLDKCDYSFEDNPLYPKNDKRWKAGWEDEETVQKIYENWSKLLKNSGKDILFSISAYIFRDWYPDNANMARTTPDIAAKANIGAIFNKEIPSDPNQYEFYSVMQAAELNNQSAQFAGNNYWNDPDMMVTGNQGLTIEEQKIHFALWCIMSSPLFLGNDPRIMSPEEKSIITNKTAIAINQDPTEQGVLIKKEDSTEVWAKKLDKGNMAVLFLNRDSKNPVEVSILSKELGISPNSMMYDVYSGGYLGKADDKISGMINPHEGLFLLVEKK